jgi:hypothetical protein
MRTGASGCFKVAHAAYSGQLGNSFQQGRAAPVAVPVALLSLEHLRASDGGVINEGVEEDPEDLKERDLHTYEVSDFSSSHALSCPACPDFSARLLE